MLTFLIFIEIKIKNVVLLLMIYCNISTILVAIFQAKISKEKKQILEIQIHNYTIQIKIHNYLFN